MTRHLTRLRERDVPRRRIEPSRVTRYNHQPKHGRHRVRGCEWDPNNCEDLGNNKNEGGKRRMKKKGGKRKASIQSSKARHAGKVRKQASPQPSNQAGK